MADYRVVKCIKLITVTFDLIKNYVYYANNIDHYKDFIHSRNKLLDMKYLK